MNVALALRGSPEDGHTGDGGFHFIDRHRSRNPSNPFHLNKRTPCLCGAPGEAAMTESVWLRIHTPIRLQDIKVIRPITQIASVIADGQGVITWAREDGEQHGGNCSNDTRAPGERRWAGLRATVTGTIGASIGSLTAHPPAISETRSKVMTIDFNSSAAMLFVSVNSVIPLSTSRASSRWVALLGGSFSVATGIYPPNPPAPRSEYPGSKLRWRIYHSRSCRTPRILLR